MKAIVVVNYADWQPNIVSMPDARGLTILLGMVHGKDDRAVLERVFVMLNDNVSELMEAHNLRSLSAHDMVLLVDKDQPIMEKIAQWYVCEDSGWRALSNDEAIRMGRMTHAERESWSTARLMPECSQCGSRVQKVDEEGYCEVCAQHLCP